MGKKNKTRSRRRRITRVALLLTALAGWMVFGGVVQFVHRGYSPFVRELDELSELSITTYPAWFPSETVDIPFAYKKLVSPDSVFFQVFVRDKERKAGPNPHVDSIKIESFSYQFGAGPSRVLIADYEQNFWMQNSAQYAQSHLDLSAVPYFPDTEITIEIEITLNGEFHALRGAMKAEERSRFFPLILHRLQ